MGDFSTVSALSLAGSYLSSLRTASAEALQPSEGVGILAKRLIIGAKPLQFAWLREKTRAISGKPRWHLSCVWNFIKVAVFDTGIRQNEIRVAIAPGPRPGPFARNRFQR